MKESAAKKYENLVVSVKDFVLRYRNTRSVEALTLPAYGKGTEANDPNKQPNVVFVKDLISQVMAAKTLGFETKLVSDGKVLSVFFVESKPSIPWSLQSL